MRIVIGGDHAGFELKSLLIPRLESLGHSVLDVGAFDANPVDFPDVTRKLCGKVLEGEAERGILCCGTGVGAAIAANKVAGIRAALCHDTYCARQGVEHDDVNVLCMGGWIIGRRTAEAIIDAYLGARFLKEDPDFVRRVAKLGEMESAWSTGTATAAGSER